MQKQIELAGKKINYRLKSSARSRYIRLVIDPDMGLVVNLPSLVSFASVEDFLHEKAIWILKHLRRLENNRGRIKLFTSSGEYAQTKIVAGRYFQSRVDFFNQHYQYQYRAIRIRNQKTIWGSCTRGGNLQFHYKLFLLPPELADYVVVHELCHLREHNHGPRFWALVAQILPNHRQLRRRLREYELRRG